MVQGKQGNNFIAGLTLEDGTTSTSTEQVVEEFLKFYKDLLGKKHDRFSIRQEVIEQGPRVTLEQASNLTAPIRDIEIHEDIFGVGEDKSPGPDGYTSAFFKKTWSVIGPLVNDAIREFFEK